MKRENKSGGVNVRPYRMLPTTVLKEGEKYSEDDAVAIETALELRIGEEFIAAFVCSPGMEEALAAGFLLTSGFLQKSDDIDSIKYSNNRCNVKLKEGAEIARRGDVSVRRVITTDCSAPDILRTLRTGGDIPKLDFELEVPLKAITQIVAEMRNSQEIHRKTGATHAALIQELDSSSRIIAEDLGRHNAVDKCIGAAISNSLDLKKCILISSGRLTADIVSKCSWASVPILVSYSVATDAGIKAAEKANVTLIGSFRGGKMRLYHEGAAKLNRS
ncbi:MAG: formate dehydrogenase accessory sulfurtransferase FdhD [Candidatus Thorarchaeota archaeon]